jgi:hypothetical protein
VRAYTKESPEPKYSVPAASIANDDPMVCSVLKDHTTRAVGALPSMSRHSTWPSVLPMYSKPSAPIMGDDVKYSVGEVYELRSVPSLHGTLRPGHNSHSRGVMYSPRYPKAAHMQQIGSAGASDAEQTSTQY